MRVRSPLMIRAPESYVFGRDADALIDMVECGINEDALMAERPRGRRGAIPFRLEFVLREKLTYHRICFFGLHLCDSCCPYRLNMCYYSAITNRRGA